VALIERIMGVEESVHGAKVPVHAFSALLRERARGRLTNTEALAEVNALLPAEDPLRPADTTEASALLTSITGAGNATAMLNRATLIDDAFLLAEAAAPGWNTPAKVRAKLGL